MLSLNSFLLKNIYYIYDMNILVEDFNLDYLIFHLVKVAQMSKCRRSKCGSIIVADNKLIIGEGYNSMPCNLDGDCFKDSLSDTFKSDKTCCVHAEQRAIMDALSKFPNKIIGSTLYFIRLDDDGNPKHSGSPYCSICSKMALDSGISNFVLWHKEGWTSYDTKEYNDITFQYK